MIGSKTEADELAAAIRYEIADQDRQRPRPQLRPLRPIHILVIGARIVDIRFEDYYP